MVTHNCFSVFILCGAFCVTAISTVVLCFNKLFMRTDELYIFIATGFQLFLQ